MNKHISCSGRPFCVMTGLLRHIVGDYRCGTVEELNLTSKRKTFLIVKNLNQLLLLPLFDMGASHPASRLPGPLFQ